MYKVKKALLMNQSQRTNSTWIATSTNSMHTVVPHSQALHLFSRESLGMRLLQHWDLPKYWSGFLSAKGGASQSQGRANAPLYPPPLKETLLIVSRTHQLSLGEHKIRWAKKRWLTSSAVPSFAFSSLMEASERYLWSVNSLLLASSSLSRDSRPSNCKQDILTVTTSTWHVTNNIQLW